jgi:hypothetical protein
MPAECCSARRLSRGRAASSLTLALGVGLALVPKCPMCLAAYLSLFGLGMTAASLLSPWCAPLALALILAAALGLARSLRRRSPARRLQPAPKAPSTASRVPATDA